MGYKWGLVRGVLDFGFLERVVGWVGGMIVR